MIIHLIHILGKRIIASGIDRLSRGVCNEGVMRVIPMLKFLHLHLSADERSSEVIPWIRSLWNSDVNLSHHCANNWYSKVFSKGNFIWIPRPAARDTVLEQLCRNVHLLNHNFHFICMPRLLTSR